MVSLQTENMILELARRIVASSSQKDFSKSLVIFPNKRPAHYLYKKISEELKSAFIPPEVFTLNEFVNQIAMTLHSLSGSSKSPLKLIGELDRIWLLFCAIQKLGINTFGDDFNEFYLWGAKIADAIDEIEMSGIDDKKLVNLSLPSLPEKLQLVISNLSKIKKEFYNEMLGRGFTTIPLNFKVVVKNFPEDILDKYTSIYLCGFYKPLPLEEKILKKLASSPVCVRINCDEAQLDFNDVSKIHIYSAFDTHSQVRKIAEILSEGFEPSKTLVVLPQPDALLPFLAEVMSRFSVPYNVSMGYPLTKMPLYAFIEMILKLQERRAGEKYYLKDYFAMILHPSIKGIITQNITQEGIYFEEKIKELFSEKTFVTLAEVETVFESNRMLREVHEKLIKAFEDISSFNELSNKLEIVMQFIVEKSVAKEHPLSEQFLKIFFEILNEMRTTLMKDYTLETSKLYALFRHFIAAVSVPFSGVPLNGLQILGMLETRNLNFEKVIIMDVIEGIMPSLSKYDPILPAGIRKLLGLMGYKERELIFRKNFVSLVNSAKEIHLIYKEHDKNIRSRYIEEIIWEKQKKIKKICPDSDMITSSRYTIRIKETEPSTISKSDSTLKILQEIVYSPTLIDTYLNCPARFYYSAVLGLKEALTPAELEPDAAQIGSCIHSILEEFFARFKGKKVHLTDNDRKHFEKIIDKKIEEYFGEVAGDVYLIAQVIKSKLFNFFNYEKSRDFKLIATEKKLESKIKLKNEEIKLTGRIDRVDKRGDNIYIIDYKTGGYKVPTDKLTEALTTREEMKKQIRSFQLPIYAYLYRENFPSVQFDKIRTLFYDLKEIKEKGIFEDGSAEEVMNKIFIPSLINLFDEILNPEIAFEKDTDDKDYCSLCAYRVLCASSGC